MNATPRERVKSILTRKGGTGAFWTGSPNYKTVPIYAKKWNIAPELEAIYRFLDDDCRWFPADAAYKHPDGLKPFIPSAGETRDASDERNILAGAETVEDIEKFPWPDVKYLDFTDIYAEIDKFPDKHVFTGMWSPFFHNVADLFGMENYFIKMHENPAVVLAANERAAHFYTEANELFFAGLGGRADTMFFGNDFGTQLDMFISPEHFIKFILPFFKKIIGVGKKYGKIVMLHSCGSIRRIIPLLIDAGIDALHPIQAQAVGMDAKSLAKYKNDLAFVGGVDAQSFFVSATPAQMKSEVRRVRSILEPNIVISPSHEAILPNVPAENVLAMAEAAREY